LIIIDAIMKIIDVIISSEVFGAFIIGILYYYHKKYEIILEIRRDIQIIDDLYRSIDRTSVDQLKVNKIFELSDKILSNCAMISNKCRKDFEDYRNDLKWYTKSEPTTKEEYNKLMDNINDAVKMTEIYANPFYCFYCDIYVIFKLLFDKLLCYFSKLSDCHKILIVIICIIISIFSIFSSIIY
jgi:hypothetical protein